MYRAALAPMHPLFGKHGVHGLWERALSLYKQRSRRTGSANTLRPTYMMTVEASPVKRPLHVQIAPQDEQYNYQMQLGTIGMRIRQSVDQGYRVPQNSAQAPNNVCVQDNSQITIPEYKRVPLPASRAAPMLVNQRTVSSSSSLEMWEDSLDQRLSVIDGDMLRNKMGAGDLDMIFQGGNHKRNWEQVDF